KDEKGWDHWMDADTGHEYAEKIADLTAFTERYQSLSVYDTVVAICEELDLSNIVEKWGDATQRRHNLSTVVNMAKTYDDMCLQMGLGSSILGFINYLTITKPENKTDNWANTIKVLTYHRSKGLEWPVVILYELWKDFVNDDDLTKKNFCGVNVCELDEKVDIFNRKHYINLFPWGIGGSGNLPLLMQEAITKLKPSDEEEPHEIKEDDFEMKLYGQIWKQAREEAIRLLYVGVTRAKDMLVSLTSVGNVPVWPEVLELEVDIEYPFGDGHNEFFEKLEESMYAEEEDENPKYRQTTNVPAINDAPLLQVSPSTIVDFENPFTRNEEAAEAGERIIDMSMFSGEQSDAVKGSCIHNFFAVYKHGDDKENVKLATQTLDNYGFPSVVLEQKEKLIASIKWLYDYLTSAYGPATRIERECPLLYPLPSGQILRGEIDLQWYYEKDGEEKCVLIDYKTFPGKRNELEKHTEKYYPQLSAYHAALTGSDVKVTDTLIYYPVQAHVRRLLK
ncbi:MAG: PD-(D/E)XK nuclease family protein, partial [Lachnospiraceae bacterium]|nr:PD-(D/E)XK nuclease family protein [Lachnospiraceae bacterium]